MKLFYGAVIFIWNVTQIIIMGLEQNLSLLNGRNGQKIKTLPP